MYGTHTESRPRTRFFAALLVMALASACTTPPPPQPAMVPLGQTGAFGYSERDLGEDRIEVTYTGADIRVSSSEGRDDVRVTAEAAKVRDLALWRAAQIANRRGMAAMRIENETRDTDVEVTRQYVQRVAPYRPFWGHPYYWPHRRYCCGPGWFYDDPFYYQPVRRAHSQTMITLTVQLLAQYDPNDETQIPVEETLQRLSAERAGAAY